MLASYLNIVRNAEGISHDGHRIRICIRNQSRRVDQLLSLGHVFALSLARLEDAMSLQQAICDAADVSAVTQLILRERLSRDLGLWEQMRECFHDDSLVRISWINASGPEFVRRSKEMAERNVKASHRLGPILVTLAGDRAIGQLAGIIDVPFALKGTDVLVSSHARFLCRAERRDGIWRLSAFDAVYLRDEMTPVIPGQTIAIDLETVKGFRPTYRLLSYCLASNGFPVSNNLAGVDRPDLVNSLVDEAYAWAGLAPPH